MGTQKVTTTATTSYSDGAAGDLVLNKRVEVEGAFNASGFLVAARISFRSDTTTRFQGTVYALNMTNKTLTIFGVTISTSTATSFEDDSSANARPFGYSQLRTGDYLELRGAEGTTPLTAAATVIVRRNLDSRRELQALPRIIALPNFTLVGVPVATTTATVFTGVPGVSGNATQAQFFAQMPGRTVKVRGTWNGAVFAATEAQLENLN